MSANWPQTLLQSRIQPGMFPEQGELCQKLGKIFTEIKPHYKSKIIQSNSSKSNSFLFLSLQEQGGRGILSHCPAVIPLTGTSHGPQQVAANSSPTLLWPFPCHPNFCLFNQLRLLKCCSDPAPRRGGESQNSKG